MSGPILYSTNVFLKLIIQQRYRQDIHYVWCSEYFDSKALSPYQPGALVPASSNPVDIYRELKRDVESRDRHSAKIAAQKLSFERLAIDWEWRGDITQREKEEIVYMVNIGTELRAQP